MSAIIFGVVQSTIFLRVFYVIVSELILTLTNTDTSSYYTKGEASSFGLVFFTFLFFTTVIYLAILTIYIKDLQVSIFYIMRAFKTCAKILKTLFYNLFRLPTVPEIFLAKSSSALEVVTEILYMRTTLSIATRNERFVTAKSFFIELNIED